MYKDDFPVFSILQLITEIGYWSLDIGHSLYSPLPNGLPSSALRLQSSALRLLSPVLLPLSSVLRPPPPDHSAPPVVLRYSRMNGSRSPSITFLILPIVKPVL